MLPKEIVSQFLRVDVSEINESTLINRKALKSSIFVHRMYGMLADAGYVIKDYSDLNTFGELDKAVNNSFNIEDSDSIPLEIDKAKLLELSIPLESINKGLSVGIDIETISSLPKAIDFREDGFYKENFNEKEIAYCILQANPYESFLGLFAIKEAIVKADNKFKVTKFREINITHNSVGKPQFSDMSISISHTDNIAFAVAIKNYDTYIPNSINENQSNNKVVLLISILALLFSVLALIIGIL